MASDELDEDRYDRSDGEFMNLSRENDFVRNGPRGWTKFQYEQYRAKYGNRQPPNLVSDPGRHPIKVGDRTMSRRRLARLVGVEASHIGMIWSGKRQPSIDLLMKIAMVFDVTTDDVLKSLAEGQ